MWEMCRTESENRTAKARQQSIEIGARSTTGTTWAENMKISDSTKPRDVYALCSEYKVRPVCDSAFKPIEKGSLQTIVTCGEVGAAAPSVESSDAS